MIKAIIVDDIKESREALKADLDAYCENIEVIGEADSVVTAAKVIKQLNPSLVFLDIQLGDGSGFDILEILGQVKFNIIFTTASDQYAVRAFKYSAIDYLLKPIDPEDLTAAVKKAEGQKQVPSEAISLLMENTKNPNKPVKRLALNTLDKIHVVNISDIIRCEADVNYTQFHFAGKNKLLVTKTLKDFEDLLKDHGFLRVHQSHLVNTNFIKEFVKSDGGYLVMNEGTNVPVSTRKRNTVVEALNSL